MGNTVMMLVVIYSLNKRKIDFRIQKICEKKYISDSYLTTSILGYAKLIITKAVRLNSMIFVYMHTSHVSQCPSDL